MNLKIDQESVNYTCQVLQIKNLRKHSNADRLQIAALQGNNLICGLDTKLDDVVLFFPVESQIGQEFAEANDLIRRKDSEGKAAGGMFEPHLRCKALTLRGEKSEGFICPVSYLDKVGIDSSKLKIGDEFTHINNLELVRKFVPKTKKIGTGQKIGKKPKKIDSKLVPGQYSLHYDTTKLQRSLGSFNESDLIVVTQKMHGSLHSMGRVLCKKKLNVFERLLRRLGVNVVDSEYADLYSSRTVIKNKDLNKNSGFYNHDIWTDCYEKYKECIEPNLTIHGELVGMLPTGQWIQKNYSYGCPPNTWDFYVYRITFTSISGKIYEFSWQQIKNYCDKFNLKHVPELFYGRASEFIRFAEKINRDVGYKAADDSFGEIFLTSVQNTFLEKKLENGSHDEGVCIRNESKDFIAFKCKGFGFLGYESAMLDKGDVGIEDDTVSEELQESTDAAL